VRANDAPPLRGDDRLNVAREQICDFRYLDDRQGVGRSHLDGDVSISDTA
jgi:hypothetical protein